MNSTLLNCRFHTPQDVQNTLALFNRNPQPHVQSGPAQQPHAQRHVCACGNVGTHKQGTCTWICDRCWELEKHRDSGPTKKHGVRMRRNVNVHRYNYPKGKEGKRAYDAAYKRALADAIGKKGRESAYGIHRRDFPPGPEGDKAWKKAYNRAYSRGEAGAK